MRCPRKNFRSTEESGQPATPEGQRPALGVGSGAHTLVGSFQSMLLQPAVHGATAQSESFGGLADISFVTRKSTLNEILLDLDRKSTRLNSSHLGISYAVFCLKKKIK